MYTVTNVIISLLEFVCRRSSEFRATQTSNGHDFSAIQINNFVTPSGTNSRVSVRRHALPPRRERSRERPVRRKKVVARSDGKTRTVRGPKLGEKPNAISRIISSTPGAHKWNRCCTGRKPTDGRFWKNPLGTSSGCNVCGNGDANANMKWCSGQDFLLRLIVFPVFSPNRSEISCKIEKRTVESFVLVK